MEKKTEILALFFLLLISGFFRFFGLMHDEPHFFNPDERNMAVAVSQFRLPLLFSQIPPCLISQIRQTNPLNQESPQSFCNLHPHFFAYGQFPLYLAFASDQIGKFLLQFPFPNQTKTNQSVLLTDFPSAIFWLRFWSALSSTFSVLLVFLLAQEFFAKSQTEERIKFSFLAAALTAFTPGLIQAAHFGTTESLLTFFFLASLFLSCRLFQKVKRNLKKKIFFPFKIFFLLSLVNGLAIATKTTGVIFLFPPLFALLTQIRKTLSGKKKGWVFLCLKNVALAFLIILGSFLFSVLFSPYNLLDRESFQSAVFGYEKDVATGEYQAFYTRQFLKTKPVLFQLEKIFPYALGWPLFLGGMVGFFLLFLSFLSSAFLSLLGKIKRKNLKSKIKNYQRKLRKIFSDDFSLLLFSSFLAYFLPNAFLFAKWTRFMTPIFPFFSLFATLGLFLIFRLFNNFAAKKQKKLPGLFFLLFLLFALLPGLAFFALYTREDSRVAASRWIYQNLPSGAYVLSETANVVDIPLGIPGLSEEKNYTVISFDFYHLEENPSLFPTLLSHLEKADYLFIPSRRIFKNHLRLPEKFPLSTRYYQLLFSGALGFEKVAEISSFPAFPPFSFPFLPRFSFPDEEAEETFTVFDHPVIRIYQKKKFFSQEEYRRLFFAHNLSQSLK